MKQPPYVIGFTGPHGSGKTTLINQLRKHYKCPVVGSSSSAIYKSYGLDCNADMPASNRLTVQEELLSKTISNIREEIRLAGDDTPIILVDRTPVDFLFYTTAALINRGDLDAHDRDRMLFYRERCRNTLKELFSCVVYVPNNWGDAQPAAEDGKQRGNQDPNYIDYCDTWMRGEIDKSVFRQSLRNPSLENIPLDLRLERARSIIDMLFIKRETAA